MDRDGERAQTANMCVWMVWHSWQDANNQYRYFAIGKGAKGGRKRAEAGLGKGVPPGEEEGNGP